MTSTKPCPKCKKLLILTATDNKQQTKYPYIYERLWWCDCGHTERAAVNDPGTAFDPRVAEWKKVNKDAPVTVPEPR